MKRNNGGKKITPIDQKRHLEGSGNSGILGCMLIGEEHGGVWIRGQSGAASGLSALRRAGRVRCHAVKECLSCQKYTLHGFNNVMRVLRWICAHAELRHVPYGGSPTLPLAQLLFPPVHIGPLYQPPNTSVSYLARLR